MVSLSQRSTQSDPTPAIAAFAGFPRDLGPLSSIVRQYLLSRPDLIGDIALPFATLQGDEFDPLSPSAIRKLISDDIGRDADGVYDWLDPIPLLQNGLTQVHLANTTAGREVVIRLRRPDAADVVARELPRLMRGIDGLAKSAGPQVVVPLKEGLKDWLKAELDAEAEIANLKRIRARGVQSASFSIPKPRGDLSGPHVAVFEALRGVPLAELLQAPRPGRGGQGIDFDRNILSGNLLRSLLHQMFAGGTFVLSFAPENIFALADDRLCILDFSHVGVVNPLINRNQYRYAAAVDSVDTERMLQAIEELAEFPSRESVEAFSDEFRGALRQWERDDGWDERRNRPLDEYFLTTVEMARRHGLVFDQSTLDMVRALVSADRLAGALSGRSKLASAARAFFSERWFSNLAKEVWRERSPSVGFDIIDFFTDSPGNLVRILSDVADRRFLLRVQTVESEASREAAAARARLLAITGLLVGICIWGAALWLSQTTSGLEWSIFSVGAATSAVAFAILWRRLG